jgi:hypothetical protein
LQYTACLKYSTKSGVRPGAGVLTQHWTSQVWLSTPSQAPVFQFQRRRTRLLILYVPRKRGQNLPMIDFGEASLGVVGAESSGWRSQIWLHSALHSVPRQQRQHLRVTHTQASPLTHPGRTWALPRQHQKLTRPSPGSRELRAETLTRQNGTENSLESSPDLSSPTHCSACSSENSSTISSYG